MLGAGAGLLLGGSGAAAAEQEVVAESLPAPTTAPTPATAPVPDNSLLSQLKSKLPPLADRPGASGKQLLQDPVEFTYAFQSGTFVLT